MTENFAAQIAEIEAQEARLQFTRFTHEDALALGLLIVRLGTERSLGITVDITKGDQQVFHVSLAGTTADNDDWIARKIRTTRRFATSSLAIRVQRDLKGGGFDWLDPELYAISGGCVPIRVGGALVGTATVSGLPDHEDHALVIEAMRALLG